MIRTVTIFATAIAVLSLTGLMLGDQQIAVPQIAAAVFKPDESDAVTLMIVREFRLPRIVLAAIVGAALAVAGSVSQTVMRNPLAEPGLLGINSGAALAALLVIVFFERSDPALVSFSAFAGALGMAALIYVLSWRSGASSIRIILIGIGLSSMAGAASSFISLFGDLTTVQSAQTWLAGSVWNANWDKVHVLAVWLLPAFIMVLLAHRELDLMSFDDMSASGLGMRVQAARAAMVLLCSLISAAAVAAAGLIGFVGLIAPHIARRLTGHRHCRVLPAAALVGASLLLGADLVGRTVIAPAQLPAGLMIVLIGAPFFAFLLWKRRNARI
ncbi:FecCD family ABC transporter permease [Roseibium aggregatum]|uniref:Iron ABC transporter permease n=1 Tax=Roseibium aggregatum TaxID=187304 RepID=A0A939EGU8_9HYPH|nr:iron ABC transporter permease [Roseibium aggregatum]MBN9672217.1 iron ABC transporter permease [Roseibium aggregatum]